MPPKGKLKDAEIACPGTLGKMGIPGRPRFGTLPTDERKAAKETLGVSTGRPSGSPGRLRRGLVPHAHRPLYPRKVKRHHSPPLRKPIGGR